MLNATLQTPWIEFRQPLARASLRLFCFPYAGGSALLFRDWQRFFPDVEVCPVQLPGRGRRMREPLVSDVVSMARAAAAGFRDFLDIPCALFGHSVGALIAYEVAELLEREGAGVRCLFVSAARAPHLMDLDKRTHLLPDADLLEELRSIKGTPEQLLGNAEVMQLLLPVIRSDFKAVQTYRCQPRQLRCPIYAFAGRNDVEVSAQQIDGWRSYTAGAFGATSLDGDHFFIHDQYPQIAATISGLLRPGMRAG